MFRILILKIVNNSNFIYIDLRGINHTHGPGSFIKGINGVLPFITDKCIFYSSQFINILKPDFYYIPMPKLEKEDFNELVKKRIINKYILGPIFIPSHWYHFPYYKLWRENHFSEILNSVKAVVVHSKRVRDHIARNSNNTNNLAKFIIMRPCTNFKPKVIKSFENRKIDILYLFD